MQALDETRDARTCPASAAALCRLISDDALGQLRSGTGLMRDLACENDVAKLAWVDHVARIVEHPAWLCDVFALVRRLAEAGMRNVIWSGMGGSVVAVRALRDLLFRRPGASAQIELHICDSADPAALNAVLGRIAARKHVTLAADGGVTSPDICRALADDTVLVAVAMGMTSEEAVTHVAWFKSLLDRAGLDPHRHVLVMALENSALHRYARTGGMPLLPLFAGPDTGFTGRTSAPGTHVFLLPSALYLASAGTGAAVLRQLLSQAWAAHDLDGAVEQPGAHPFVSLAVALSAVAQDGTCHLMLALPPEWRPLHLWIEQLMEQSLGKDGKGVVVFSDQRIEDNEKRGPRPGVLRVAVSSGESHARVRGADFLLPAPTEGMTGPHARLAGMARWFLGWQLTAAVYAYLHRIEIAPEPAVERYKAIARVLRAKPLPAPLPYSDHYPGTVNPMAGTLAQALLDAKQRWRERGVIGYLDLTVNGETESPAWEIIEREWRAIGNGMLGVPVKLRRAPAEYHVSEQSEMDGPRGVLSVRVINRLHEPVALGAYDDGLLKAQAIAAWRAMNERGRLCYLLVTDDAKRATNRTGLIRYLQEVHACLASVRERGR